MNSRVYFHCREEANAYQDDVVVLAEGLRENGVEVFGNCNYWRRSTEPDDWLVRHDPRITPEECDIVVVSYGWSRWIDSDFKVHAQALPKDLFSEHRQYRTAYLDLDDGYETQSWKPEFRAFDLILRAKYNRRCFHPANQRPWALGVNQRMIDCTKDAMPWSQRRPEVLVNFGASHSYVHGARAKAGPPFVAAARGCFTINNQRDDLTSAPSAPYEHLMWEQTQGRHSRSYYERLKSAQAIVAFCGELIPPAPFAPKYLVGGGKARMLRSLYKALELIDSRPPRLIQWDSWRFWEGLAAGCLVFNFDLPFYGVELPVMPRDFEHYVAVRPDNMTEVFARLLADSNLGQRIAEEGHNWALKHYSPSALARRFLAMIPS